MPGATGEPDADDGELPPPDPHETDQSATPSGGTPTAPAAPVTDPTRALPGWCVASSATASSAAASGTTATKPQPMLKTPHSSASGTLPRSSS